MKVCFELTMPNVGSWNGKWTGADKKYYIVRTYFGERAKQMKAIEEKEVKYASWYYDFGDGWGASVLMEIIDATEAKKRLKNSKGFAGYDWMVNEIEAYGRILGRKERQLLREQKQYNL